MRFGSAGCQPCKSRKLKCDNATPSCKRCLRAQRPCYGTRQSFSVFHEENAYASGRQKRPRGPRSAPKEPQQQGSTGSAETNNELPPRSEDEAAPAPLHRTAEDSDLVHRGANNGAVLEDVVHSSRTGRGESVGVLLCMTPDDIHRHAVSYYMSCHLHRPAERPGVLHTMGDDLFDLWKPDLHHSIPTCPPPVTSAAVFASSPNSSSSSSSTQPSTSTSASTNVLLDLAASSLALALFSRAHRSPLAAAQATRTYQALIRCLQPAIRSLRPDNLQQCLLAVLLMSLFETSMHRLPNTTSTPGAPPAAAFARTLQGKAHQSGALALIKHWKSTYSSGPRQGDDGTLAPEAVRVPNVIKHGRRMMLKWFLLRDIAMPDWIQDGQSFGESDLDLEYDNLRIRILRARQSISAIQEQRATLGPLFASHLDEEHCAILKDLVPECEDIEARFQQWSSDLPLRWAPEHHVLSEPPPSSLAEHFYSSHVLIHKQPTHAAVWMQYYANRMLANSTRLAVISLLHSIQPPESPPPPLEYSLDDSVSTIRSMADLVAFTIPSCLDIIHIRDNTGRDGRHRLIIDQSVSPHHSYLANLCTYSLIVAASNTHIDKKQRDWLRGQVVQVGRMMGYGVFEAAKPGNQWLKT